MTPAQPLDAAAGRRRSAARLAAVQAIYQMAQTGEAAGEVVRQFEDHRFDAAPDEAAIADPDRSFFADLVAGAAGRREELEALIGTALARNWSLARIEQVVKAILTVGVFELKYRPDVPAPVVINEYVEIAHAFYAEGEPGFVNSVLDRLGQELRSGELEQRPPRRGGA